MTDPMQARCEEAARIKMTMLEKLAAAFLQETGLKASECELVQEASGNTITWYCRRRKLLVCTCGEDGSGPPSMPHMSWCQKYG